MKAIYGTDFGFCLRQRVCHSWAECECSQPSAIAPRFSEHSWRVGHNGAGGEPMHEKSIFVSGVSA